MAPQADLRVIGSEGFALIDKLYGPFTRRKAKSNGVFPARQGHWVIEVPNDEMEDPAMNSRDAAARYGGIMTVTYPKPKTHLKP